MSVPVRVDSNAAFVTYRPAEGGRCKRCRFRCGRRLPTSNETSDDQTIGSATEQQVQTTERVEHHH